MTDLKTLQGMIKNAVDREDVDDHLTIEERETIVSAYLDVYPKATLTEDTDLNYVSIIYDEPLMRYEDGVDVAAPQTDCDHVYDHHIGTYGNACVKCGSKED